MWSLSPPQGTPKITKTPRTEHVRKILDTIQETRTNIRNWAATQTVILPAYLTPYVYSVGGEQPPGRIWENTQTGPWISGAAPATQVISLNPAGGLADTTTATDPPAPVSGTSFSTALVSGLAALLRQKYPNDTAADTIARINAATIGVSDTLTNRAGHGWIDPLQALTGHTAAPARNTGGRAQPTATDPADTGSSAHHHRRNQYFRRFSHPGSWRAHPAITATGQRPHEGGHIMAALDYRWGRIGIVITEMWIVICTLGIMSLLLYRDEKTLMYVAGAAAAFTSITVYGKTPLHWLVCVATKTPPPAPVIPLDTTADDGLFIDLADWSIIIYLRLSPADLIHHTPESGSSASIDIPWRALCDVLNDQRTQSTRITVYNVATRVEGTVLSENPRIHAPGPSRHFHYTQFAKIVYPRSPEMRML